MSLSINTNMASLQAQNNLAQVNKSLEQNQERLSSGLRINSAADDAAGLAISDRMTAQIKGMNQAKSNAQNGISMAQTAEGGMQEITNILQRMREIGVQSANETNTDSDRESLNDEYSKLSSELNRIAKSTSFNGKNLLNGGEDFNKQEAVFQVGANTGDSNEITVDMSSNMKSSALGTTFENTLGLADGAGGGNGTTLGTNELSVNGNTLDLSNYNQHDEDGSSDTMPASGEVRTSAWGIAQAINDSDSITDVSAEAQTVTTSGTNAATATISSTGDNSTYSLKINDVTITSITDTSDDGSAETISASAIADKINAAGVNAQATATADGIQLSATNGGNIEVDESVSTGSSGNGTGIFAASQTTTIARGGVNLTSTSSITVTDSSNNGDEFTNTFSSGSLSFNNSTHLDNTNIKTVDAAKNAINVIDNAISEVDSFRATMGATQNRLDSTIANLENASQNLTDSRSRIKDADIAKEAADQTMNNVRRQATASVLTQANQSPQLALQLLGG